MKNAGRHSSSPTHPSGLKLILPLIPVLLAAGCSPDYCEDAKRPLSDAELIEKVVSPEEIYPHCCRVSRGGSIKLENYKRVRDADGTKQKHPEFEYYEEHLTVDACGKVLSGYGMHVKDKERPCWTREERVSAISNEELVRAALAKAKDQMRLTQAGQSVDQFFAAHPMCCRVQKAVKDEHRPKMLNPAQVEVYYKAKEYGEESVFRIVVGFNACADWTHVYGPTRLEPNLVPTWVN